MASPATRKDLAHDDEPRQSAETQMSMYSHTASSHTTENPRYREAIRLWLRWNEAYETTTGRMFEKRSDPQALQDEMDLMDQLRRQAITISQELLENSTSDCPTSD